MGLEPGAVFAGFTIERLLGAGGMGSVYLAEHPRLRRQVALKVLANTFSVDAKTRSAFDREARLAAELDHPNIVAVYDRSEADDPALWLAMRYVGGGDAAGLLRDDPDGLAPDRAVRLLEDAAHALDYAHAQGVLHRDVKPANLLIENDRRHGERAVLTDFGIARTLDDTVTLSGIAATFAYAAPERFEDAPADHRADIYSLGCTLFQLLTGQPPFPRKDQAAVIGAHLTAPPPSPHGLRPGLPAELDAVIATAMAKSPADRYPTCTALAEAAARALPASVVNAEPTRPVVISKGSALERAAAATVVPAAASANGAAGPVSPPAPDTSATPAVVSGPKSTAPEADPAPVVIRAAMPPVVDQADLPTVVRGGVSLAKVERRNPPAQADRPDRRRFAVVSGLFLAGVGVAVAAAFAVRGNESPSTGTTTSTAVVSQQVTPSSTPVQTTVQPTTTPPAETSSPVESPLPVNNEPPAEQYVPTYTAERPVNPPAQAPVVVPQTRVHQWGE